MKLRGIYRYAHTIFITIMVGFCMLYSTAAAYSVFLAERWLQPGLEFWRGFVHSIMQRLVSANIRDLSLSKTPHFPGGTLKYTTFFAGLVSLSPDLSRPPAQMLRHRNSFQETVMQLLSSAMLWSEWTAHFKPPETLFVILLQDVRSRKGIIKVQVVCKSMYFSTRSAVSGWLE